MPSTTPQTERTIGELAFIRFLNRCPVEISAAVPRGWIIVRVGGGVHPTVLVGDKFGAAAVATGELDRFDVQRLDLDEF